MLSFLLKLRYLLYRCPTYYYVFVLSGDPLPKVTWWQSGSLFDSSDEVTRTGVIINRMVYKGLTREDLGKTFTCQAANTNLTIPVAAEVKIILNRKFGFLRTILHNIPTMRYIT